MHDIQARLSRVSTELVELEKLLKQIARDNGGQSVPICDQESLNDLHGAVDRVRHLLWPYVEAAARRARGLDEALQTYRMQRVTAMLNDLSERVAEPRMAAVAGAEPFFSNIQQIATTAVERHMERVSGVPAKRSVEEPEPLAVEPLLA